MYWKYDQVNDFDWCARGMTKWMMMTDLGNNQLLTSSPLNYWALHYFSFYAIILPDGLLSRPWVDKENRILRWLNLKSDLKIPQNIYKEHLEKKTY